MCDALKVITHNLPTFLHLSAVAFNINVRLCFISKAAACLDGQVRAKNWQRNSESIHRFAKYEGTIIFMLQNAYVKHLSLVEVTEQGSTGWRADKLELYWAPADLLCLSLSQHSRADITRRWPLDYQIILTVSVTWLDLLLTMTTIGLQ